jgi:hypothetical protein
VYHDKGEGAKSDDRFKNLARIGESFVECSFADISFYRSAPLRVDWAPSGTGGNQNEYQAGHKRYTIYERGRV